MSTIWSLLSRRSPSVRRAPKSPSRRLWLELLEDRLAPAAHIGSDTYATIQAAVNAANNGAVITVDPGAYHEQVTVNKSVTIEGANAGINGASTQRTSESSVSWAAGPTFIIAASNVTIDGFTVGDMTTPSGYLGILISGGVSGTHIQDNVIENNGGGIGLANGSGGQAVIQGNLISANTHSVPGSNANTTPEAPGVGIWYGSNMAAGPLQNVLIQNNTFSANDIQLDGINPSQQISDITISNNWGDEGIDLTGTTNATISGNSLVYKALGPTITPSGVVNLYGNDHNISITNNVLAGNTYGVLVRNIFNLGANSNVTLYDNSITAAGFVGLHIDANGWAGPGIIAYSGVLNASGNWWGSATGPTTPDNPGGSGTAIDDPNHQVVFTPWLSSGVNNAAPGQPGFYGDQGSLISSNPASTTGGGGSSGGSGNSLSTLQQQVVNDLVLAQQFQGNLSGLEQQLSAWFVLAGQQSLDDALALVFDEAALTAGCVLVLQESQLGMQDAALLSAFDSLDSAIQANPLASTPAGQQVIALTGALVAAKLQ